MDSLIKPGMLFQADCLPYPGQGGLEATTSSYGIHDLEGAPRPRTTYVVCRDGSIQDHHDRTRSIGWELLEDGSQWYYRATQMNHKPKPLAVFYKGVTDDVPEGRGKIGSAVRADPPQMAEITVQNDDGEEVTSRCPGAPMKTPRARKTEDLVKIAKNLGPGLALAAMALNDPDQTAALAQFAEGNAEMRGLYG